MPNELMTIDLETMFENIRQTEDGKYSIYDYLHVCTNYTNTTELFKRICRTHSDVLSICEEYKFPRKNGRINNQSSPVTDERGLLYIQGLLPGIAGKKYRQAAADLVYRRLQNDVTLAEEIVAQTDDDTTRVAVIATTKVDNDNSRQVIAETAINTVENTNVAEQIADYAQTQVEYLGSYHQLHREIGERGAVNTWGNKRIPYRKRRNTHAQINKINTEAIGQTTCGSRSHYTLEEKTQLTLIQQVEHKRIVRHDIVGHDELVDSCDYVANTLSDVINQLVG